MRLAPGTFLRWAAPSPSELGCAGEELAARWLLRRGWRILARRHRTSLAEIDLVASLGGELVCVEVKTGRVREPGPVDAPERCTWRPGERLDARTLERQRRTASRLAAGWSGGISRRGRVDLIEVLVGSGRAAPRIVHHPHLTRPI